MYDYKKWRRKNLHTKITWHKSAKEFVSMKAVPKVSPPPLDSTEKLARGLGKKYDYLR